MVQQRNARTTKPGEFSVNRAELEAFFWRTLHDQGCGCAQPWAVDAMLDAAEAYALAKYGITADRRAELEAAVRPARPETVHYGGTIPACNQSAWNPKVTARRSLVTCLRCKETRAWKAEAA